jgi:hypothetical protein
MFVIRAPHGHRSRTVPVVKSRKGKLEIALLTFAWITFFLALIWIATPVFAFADYPLHPVPLVTGPIDAPKTGDRNVPSSDEPTFQEQRVAAAAKQRIRLFAIGSGVARTGC